jgi:hypothetical protein
VKLLLPWVQVVAMILGRQQAPWEQEDKRSVIVHKLGPFRKAVMAMLNRNPDARPQLAEFLQSCHSVLSRTTEQLTS